MAPRKKTYRKFRLYKRPSNKYLRISLDAQTTIKKIGTTFGFENTNSILWSIAAMISGSATWTNYSKVFSFVRLRGISITTIPSPTCNSTTTTTPFYVNIAYFARGVAQDVTREQVLENPTCLTLSPLEKQYKYLNLLGDTGDWVNFVSSNFKGGFCLDSTVNPAAEINLGWSLKVTMYFTLKLPQV